MNYPIVESVPFEWAPGDVILDLYEVKPVNDGQPKRPYHEGGFGRVYKVWHRSWNCHMAVKTPRPGLFETQDQKDVFTRECETWIDLSLHPNIAACHYVRDLGGVPRIFSEYADAGTLAEWISSGKLYEGDVTSVLCRMLDFAVQFAWGLHHAHESGVIHQDVKPANSLIFGKDVLKVCDFGIAGMKAKSIAEGPSICKTIMVKGSNAMTLAYCSPEQYAAGPLSRRSDIWSWGLSVLEMFAGGVTWHSGTVAREILDQHISLETQDQAIPKLPSDLFKLLRSCFEVDPNQRPRSALECACVLQEIIQDCSDNKHSRATPTATNSTAGELNNKALSLLDIENSAEALELLRKAHQIDPSDLAIAYNLGLLQWRSHLISDNCLIDAIASRVSANDSPCLEMGLAYHELGYFQEAIDCLANAKETGYRDLLLKACYYKSAFQQTAKSNLRLDRLTHEDTREIIFTRDSEKVIVLADCLYSWNLKDGRVRHFEKFEKAIKSIRLQHNGSAILGTYENGIVIWDLVTGRILSTVELKTPLWNFVPLPDNKTIIGECYHGTYNKWDHVYLRFVLSRIDLETGRVLHEYDKETYGDQFAGMSSDGTVIATLGKEDSTFITPWKIHIWRLSDGRGACELKSLPSPANLQIHFFKSHDFTRLFCTDQGLHTEGGWDTFDLTTRDFIKMLPAVLGGVECFVPSENEELAVTYGTIRQSGEYLGQWSLFDVKNIKLLRILYRGVPGINSPYSLEKKEEKNLARISPDGRCVVWIREDNSLQSMWIGNCGKSPYILQQPEDYWTVRMRDEEHRKLIDQVDNVIATGKYGEAAALIRENQGHLRSGVGCELSKRWDQLASGLKTSGILALEKIHSLDDDRCLFPYYSFHSLCCDRSSPEVFIGISIFDRKMGGDSAGILRWNAETKNCEVVAGYLRDADCIEALAIWDAPGWVIGTDGRFVLCVDSYGKVVWRLDRTKGRGSGGKFAGNITSIHVSDCETRVVFSLRSWEGLSPRQLRIEVWDLDLMSMSLISVPISVHAETEFSCGAKFLDSWTIIFGCNLGIQICRFEDEPGYMIFGGSHGSVFRLEVSSCYKYVAAAYESGNILNLIVVWELGDAPREVVTLVVEDRVRKMAFGPGADMLLVHLANGVLCVYSITTSECFHVGDLPDSKIELSDDGSTVFVIRSHTVDVLRIVWDLSGSLRIAERGVA